jgi:hypothetical protein
MTAKDTTGASLTTGGSWNFTTVKPSPPEGTCPCGLFTDATTPSVLQNIDNPVTLGVSFHSTLAGTVSGIRFYKSAGNTGTHIGALWSASGQQLAVATFTGESSSGWQTVTFASPVTIAANTVYVASYSSPNGVYSATPGDFSGAGVTRGPLVAGNNAGAYSYPGGFPGSTSPTNYLVDVVFAKTAPPVSVVSQSPASAAMEVPTSSQISLTLSVPVAPGYTFAVKNGSSAIDGSAALSADAKTITFTPASALPDGATISVSVSGVTSTEGATLAAQTWSFDTKAAVAPTLYSLFGSRSPATPAATDDASAVELGVSFTSSQAGTVSAIRFYKGTTNTGTHTGSLWSSTGTRLATVTFSGETATGWQTAQLSTPVAITAGTTYVVSYFAPTGNYAYTPNDFAQATTNGPLTAGTANNGRYLYGSAGGFPVYSWNATNYFVDVVFTPDGSSSSGTPTTPPPTTPPTTPPPTTPPPTPPTTPAGATLFADSSVPANTSWPDGAPVQLGVRFSSSQAGTITGIRFYKGAGDAGTHTASLWTATGTLLATADFASETASGWQDVAFTTPVSIQADTEYRASYHTTATTYATDPGALGSAVVRGPLTTLASGGAYSYSTGFPDQVVTHNYWVDIHFVPSP